ncbi:uncharacterized protein LOC112093398, partial [Morus notabilis]|uniref:uncharacterized protein LOC112093398 n=1 Tax=Morus notabilis TaxID=981085 RepID=UPI000CED1930
AQAKLEFGGSNPVLDKHEPESAVPNSVFVKASRFGSICYKFIRPYAMIQVIIASICLFARVLVENPQLFKWSLLFKAIPGLIAIIHAHVYNFGINQIFDADIDRINKPYLPIPSGDLSLKQAWFLMIFSVLSGLLILRVMNADLITTSFYCFGILLATLYNAPPFRFKGSPVATIITIPLNTTIINNIGVLYATMTSLRLPFWWSPQIIFITIFGTLFFAVTCIIKDISDVEGDMKHNIRTFAATFGSKNMALLGMGILLVNYIGAIGVAIFMPQAFKRRVMLSAHSISALWLLFQAKKLDKANYGKASAKDEFAGSDSGFGKAQPASANSISVVAKVLHFGSTCYKFVRPYAMIQVIVSSVSFFARVLAENPQLFKCSLLLKAFPGLIAMILAHVYSNGINQIFDADIDRVNKPYLPIPAGEFSLKQAWLLMIFSVLAGQLILWVMKADPITSSLYWLGYILSTMYSAPPFRFKESSVATTILIPSQTIINNVGVIYTTMASLGLPFRLSPAFVFILTFNTLFFVVNVIIKDIEDVEGDMKHNIRTFAAIFGPKNIVLLGTGILLVNYIGAIAAAIFMPQAFKRHVMLPAHLIPALQLLFQAKMLDKENYAKEASAKFYKFLWRLLTLEFLSLPFM